MYIPKCVIALLLAAAASSPSQAARSYDNCTGFVRSLPTIITTQGTWCLDRDLATNLGSGSAITLATNNVTLDCNDFKLGGLAAGPTTLAVGIHALNRLNLTVRNCNIRGFHTGVALEGNGAGHVVEDNRIEASTLMGINLFGSYSTIRRNLVVDTGDSINGSPNFFGIQATGDGLQVFDNTVYGVAVEDLSASTVGIFVNGDGIVGRNHVAGLDDTSLAVIAGIYTAGGRPVLHDNVLKGPNSETATLGIRCSSLAGTARDNVLVGFDTPVELCTSVGNVVNPN